MAWIDYKKAYDLLPETWIVESLKMFKISDWMIYFNTNGLENWRVELIARRQTQEAL